MTTKVEPENTAARVALWRALHLQVDPPPHILRDEIGLQLLAPPEGWQKRGDMHPIGTRPFRASILARARFLEDLLEQRLAAGVAQYVILGAGLDTFAQRRPELASRMQVFEIDQKGPQSWKRSRLEQLGFGIPDYLHLVPVDFEAGASWLQLLAAEGFDPQMPALVASTGVSMYLTRAAVSKTLREVASLAAGSTFVMSFMLPIALAEPALQASIRQAEAGARANGTPWLSFFEPDEMLELARRAGFKSVEHISASGLSQRYFANRTDGMRLPENSEELLVATA